MIVLDKVTFRMLEDYANNNHRVYRFERLRGGLQIVLLVPSNKNLPMSIAFKSAEAGIKRRSIKRFRSGLRHLTFLFLSLPTPSLP